MVPAHSADRGCWVALKGGAHFTAAGAVIAVPPLTIGHRCPMLCPTVCALIKAASPMLASDSPVAVTASATHPLPCLPLPTLSTLGLTSCASPLFGVLCLELSFAIRVENARARLPDCAWLATPVYRCSWQLKFQVMFPTLGSVFRL